MGVEMEISPEQLKELLDAGEAATLLDIRTADEVARCTLPGSTWIPMNELPQRVGELDRTARIVVYCHAGVRSLRAAHYLRVQAGFEDVRSLAGGIDGWSRRIDPSLPRY